MIRSSGDAEVLAAGRTAQKRISDARKLGAEPAAADKHLVNRARKARKKASKALQGTE